MDWNYARRTCSTNSKVKFKTSVFKSSLRGYSDAYLTVKNTGKAAVPNSRKNITIKNCAPFTDCISEIKKIYK